MEYFKKIFKIILNPDYFPYGSEVKKAEIIKRNEEVLFQKIFRNNKIDKYIKSLYLLNMYQDLEFIPKLIEKDDNNLKIVTTYCGKLANTERLPKDWKNQLIKIRNILIKKKLSFIDWGPWDINPYVLNNICIKDNKIFFIDLGDCKYDSKENINKYFNDNIEKIELILSNKKRYIYLHYLKCIYNMVYRKASRLYNWFFILSLFLVYYYF
jgi:hypothetical protein